MKPKVCKTFIRQFDPGPRLQQLSHFNGLRANPKQYQIDQKGHSRTETPIKSDGKPDGTFSVRLFGATFAREVSA